jgi:hypothetical protein
MIRLESVLPLNGPIGALAIISFFSLDSGVSWTSYGDPFSPNTSFSLQTFDLSGIAGLTNNPKTGFRILFDGASSSSDNNRINNLVIWGNPVTPPVAGPVPESSTLALTITGLAGVFLVRKYKSNRGLSRFGEQRFCEIKET